MVWDVSYLDAWSVVRNRCSLFLELMIMSEPVALGDGLDDSQDDKVGSFENLSPAKSKNSDSFVFEWSKEMVRVTRQQVKFMMAAMVHLSDDQNLWQVSMPDSKRSMMKDKAIENRRKSCDGLTLDLRDFDILDWKVSSDTGIVYDSVMG